MGDVKEKQELDSDDSEELQTEEKDKERHSSGESIDSAVCFSTPTSPIKSESPHRFLVIPSDLGKQDSNVKGILRRTRGYSETNVDFLRMASPAESETSTIAEEDAEDEVKREKKSVRFNEVVQRQVYRSNSSILGQKMKNQKKNQQKMRKRAERRPQKVIRHPQLRILRILKKVQKILKFRILKLILVWPVPWMKPQLVKSSKRKTRLTTIILKRKTKNKENYKNKNYKKFTTILISFSTWISKKNFFAALFKNNFICSLFFPPIFFIPKCKSDFFFQKSFFLIPPKYLQLLMSEQMKISPS